MDRPPTMEIVGVTVTPETRAFDTDYDRGPLTPGLSLEVVIRNGSDTTTYFIVADRVTVEYDDKTATLTARFEPPSAQRHHGFFVPSSEALKPRESTTIAGWIPLRGAEFFPIQVPFGEDVDATDWTRLRVVVSAGTSPLRPSTLEGDTSWPVIERQWRRDELSVERFERGKPR